MPTRLDILIHFGLDPVFLPLNWATCQFLEFQNFVHVLVNARQWCVCPSERLLVACLISIEI